MTVYIVVVALSNEFVEIFSTFEKASQLIETSDEIGYYRILRVTVQ